MEPIVAVEPTDWDELAEYARELAPGESEPDDDEEEATEAADAPTTIPPGK